MLPELFRIPTPWGSIPIFSYGLMMVIGFLAAVQLAKFLSRRSGIDPELFVNAALIALVAGVVGARLSHILENLGDYTRSDLSAWQNFLNMINIRSGGLTFYGGLILAFPLVVLYGIFKKVPVRIGMDIAAPCITLGLAFGRIGCFLNGCCYGAECNLPWAVRFPYHSNAYVEEYYAGEIKPPDALIVEGADGRKTLLPPEEAARNPGLSALASQQRSRSLHPAQLYSSLNSFLITAMLVAFFTLRPSPGRVMALMLMAEGATRFLLEIVRAEPPVYPPLFGTWSLSMVLGLGLVIVGGGLWFALGPRREDVINPVSAIGA